MNPQKLKETLAEDWEFFSIYKDKFLRYIKEELSLKEKHITRERLETFLKLCGEIYEVLFNPERSVKDLYTLFEELLFKYGDYAKFLITALAYLAYEYTNFLINQELNFKKLYALYTFYSFIFFTFQKLYGEVKKRKIEEVKKKLLQEIIAIKEKLGINDEELLKEVLLSLLGEAEEKKRDISVKELKKEAVSLLNSGINTEFNRSYKNVTESGEKELLGNIERIFSLLEEIKEKDNKLEVRTYYKGLPVICVASITDLDPSMNLVVLESKLCKYKIFYQPGQEVFLHHPLLPISLKGKIFKGEPKEGILIVSDLRMEEDKFARRRYVRVELEQPIQVEVLTKGKKYFGVLKDISQRGAAVRFTELPPLEKGNILKLRIPLEGFEIETLAVVRRVDDKEKEIGVEFQLPYPEEKRLIQYILQKQQEILNRLRYTSEE